MNRSNALTLVLASLLALSVVGGIGGLAAADGGNDGDSYELDELRDGGNEIAGADPSTRWVDDGSVYVEHSPANPLLSTSSEEWEVDSLLASGDTVETNQLTLHADRNRGAGTDELEARVVYWQAGERERSVGDGETVTEPVAKNVTTQTHEITFSGAFDQETIDLARSDEPRQVSLYLVDADSGQPIDGARWQFEHHSVATSYTAPISTMGDLLVWSFWWIVAPTLVGLMIVGIVVPKLIKAAGNASPEIDWPLWAIGIGTISFFTFILAYTYLASALVALPIVFPFAICGFTTALLLETYDDGVEKWAFFGMRTTETTGPTGDAARDAVAGTFKGKRVAMVDGKPTIPSRGLRAFIARIWVGPTVLEGAKSVAGSLPLEGSKYDEMVFLADEPGKPLKHMAETLMLAKPDYRDPVTIVFSAVALISTIAIAAIAWGTWWYGLALAFPVLVAGCFRPVPGHAEVTPAPSQTRSAYATAVYLEAELEQYDTVEDLAEALITEVNRSEEIREMLEDLEDSTIIKQSHSREGGSLFSNQLTKESDDDDGSNEVPADD